MGFVKGNIYGNNPHAVEKFKTEITTDVESINEEHCLVTESCGLH
jgi:hypothetical protein